MENIGIEVRSEVLRDALMLEDMTSIFLAQLLGIKKSEDSRTLGNKSSALSFNHKISLLMDLDILDQTTVSKFEAFMKIRNQFMHNYSAVSFESCMSFLSGTDKFLLKTYPQPDKWSNEERLHMAYTDLSHDIQKITLDIHKTVELRLTEHAQGKISTKFKDATFKAMREVREAVDSVYHEAIKLERTTLSVEELKGLGTILSSVFYKIIEIEMGFTDGDGNDQFTDPEANDFKNSEEGSI